VKKLAEGIIIQSIEDLWSRKDRRDAIDFFDGDGVGICAELAEMSLYDEVRLFNIVNEVISSRNGELTGRTKASNQKVSSRG
jgi:hypothetical protein